MTFAYNPPRGCGTLRKGGFYAQGGMSPNGTLAAWTWTLGHGFEGGGNLYIELPARQMTIGRLRETLITGRFVSVEGTAIEVAEMPPQIAKLPPFALFDHIGANNYSAWSFASEAIRHGVSRRIPQDIAAQVAKLAPLPIVFTHSVALTVEAEADYYYHRDVQAWAEARISEHKLREHRLLTNYGADPEYGTDVNGYQVGSTFDDPAWGIERNAEGRKAYNGGLHPMVKVFAALDAVGAGKDAQRVYKELPAELHGLITIAEQVVGISWVTQASYIKRGDELEALIDKIEAMGIVPLDLKGSAPEDDEDYFEE